MSTCRPQQWVVRRARVKGSCASKGSPRGARRTQAKRVTRRAAPVDSARAQHSARLCRFLELVHDLWAALTPPTRIKMAAESTKEATADGHKVTTVVEGTDATAAPPAEPSGKVAIVTGASRVLCRCMAAVLAKEAGFTVHAVGRTTADLETPP